MNRFQVIPAAYLLLTRGEGDDLEVLLQLRGPGTSYMPGHWASGAAGHVELGESVFDETWARGRAMTLDEALDYALDEEIDDELAPPQSVQRSS